MNTAAKLVRRGSQYFSKDKDGEAGGGGRIGQEQLSPEEAALREQTSTPQPPSPGASCEYALHLSSSFASSLLAPII